jgi:peptidoglycan/LPS O-acetylase OafA/YrhL
MRLGYRPELDGLRGLAIALVVAFHAFGWPPGGTVGVDLFFVLSGFLISTLLLEEHHATRTISICNFYVRRARRLFPALAALLAPFVFLVIVGAAVGSFQTRTAVGIGAALTYTSNIVVAVDPSAVPAAMIHLWSLAAEEQFYVLWPLALVVLLRLGGLRFLVGGLGVLLAVAIFHRLELVAGGASIERLYYGPDTHADALLIGSAFGCLFVGRRLPRSLTSSARVRLAVGSGALVLVGATAVFLDRVPERLAYQVQLLPPLFALAAGTLILSAVAGPSALTVALCTRPLLLAVFVASTAARRLGRRAPPCGCGHPGGGLDRPGFRHRVATIRRAAVPRTRRRTQAQRPVCFPGCRPGVSGRESDFAAASAHRVPRAEVVDRIDFITASTRGKSVIDLGFVASLALRVVDGRATRPRRFVPLRFVAGRRRPRSTPGSGYAAGYRRARRPVDPGTPRRQPAPAPGPNRLAAGLKLALGAGEASRADQARLCREVLDLAGQRALERKGNPCSTSS